MEFEWNGIIVTHLCSGHMQMSYSPNKRFFECVESKDSGAMTLIEDHGESLSVRYCPFCGKESTAHAALKQEDIVRTVEHAI